MFDHLDDQDPHSLGTDHQLAAARNRGRQLARHTRRNRLAVGSAAVAATAGVTAVAVVGLPGQSVAGTAADSSASPYPIPTPTASSSPTPAPAAPVSSASPVGTVSPAPVPVPGASGLPYPAPPALLTAPAGPTASPVPVPPTATPTAATVAPAASASPTATAAPVAPTVSPTTMTADCAKVTAALLTTPMPSGFTPLVPPSGVLSWYRAGAPLKSVVVTVACHPFHPSQVAAGLAVKEVTVLDAHSWLIGDPSTGKLELTWDATDSTSVTVDAQVTLPEMTGQVEDQLLTFGNMLIT